jgi:hypothetical protein
MRKLHLTPVGDELLRGAEMEKSLIDGIGGIDYIYVQHMCRTPAI